MDITTVVYRKTYVATHILEYTKTIDYKERLNKKFESASKYKIAIGTAASALFSFFGLLAVPLLVVITNIIDWCIGIMASHIKGEVITSAKSLDGIARKVVMYILMIDGFAIDILITYVTKNMAISVMLPNIFACFIAIWLVLNELISITENCDADGVNTSFL